MEAKLDGGEFLFYTNYIIHMENVNTVVDNLKRGSSVERLLDLSLSSPRKYKIRDVGKRGITTKLLRAQKEPHTLIVPSGSTLSGTFTTTDEMTIRLPYRGDSKGGRASRRYSNSSKRKSKRTKKTRIV
jgi:hypothetical protein